MNEPSPSLAPVLSGMEVLIADDARDNRLLLGKMLEKAGARVRFAEDGAQACEFAWRKPPDLILMDLQMPEVDGVEATRRLRASGFDRPIVACTAFAIEGELERCLSAGCDDAMTKPVSFRRLVETVHHHVTSARSSAADEA